MLFFLREERKGIPSRGNSTCEGPDWCIQGTGKSPCERRAGARGGDLGYELRERAGPDVAGPCAPSKGV